MKAATVLRTSSIRGEHLHAGKKLMHSPSPGHLSCRFQAPSAATTCLNMCREAETLLTRSGWIPEKRTRAKIECQGSLINTVSTCTATLTIPTTTSPPTDSITTYKRTQEEPSATYTFRRQPEHDEVGVQELTVYEVNERDRDSPVLLFSSKMAVDWYKRLTNIANLGDLVPFSNKLFDGSLKKRLGITAGIISVIRYYPKESGVLFEAAYSFYFGDLGHISVQGPYKTHEDTVLTVTGGTGIFNGVYGTVEICNIEFPVVLFYTFKLYGIAQLPEELKWKTVPPREGLRPSRNASSSGFALRIFTD